jgi:HD-GYP domain-containing protein (c-di-GMP phosphodiesterase class II)
MKWPLSSRKTNPPDAGRGAAWKPRLWSRKHEGKREERKLASLLEFTRAVTSREEALNVGEHILRALLRDTQSTQGYIMLVNKEGNGLATEIAISLEEERVFPASRPFGEGIEGSVAEYNKLQMLSRSQQAHASRFPTSQTNLVFPGEAALCVPIMEPVGTETRRVLGVLVLAKYQPKSSFLPADLDLTQTLAGFAGLALVNARQAGELRDSFVASLQALAHAMDAKTPYTEGHSARVSELCVRIARKLHVAPEVIDDLRTGALIYDVGKVGIPDTIITKPGQLTDEEFALQKQHPVIGYELCKSLGLGDHILMLIRNHHEKLDGTGYPDGLKQGEIPLPLRIICVADAFDAMSYRRSYRQALDARERNEQLNRFAGSQFDPVVVETLKGMMNAHELDDLYRGHWEPGSEEPLSAPAPLHLAA